MPLLERSCCAEVHVYWMKKLLANSEKLLANSKKSDRNDIQEKGEAAKSNTTVKYAYCNIWMQYSLPILGHYTKNHAHLNAASSACLILDLSAINQPIKQRMTLRGSSSTNFPILQLLTTIWLRVVSDKCFKGLNEQRDTLIFFWRANKNPTHANTQKKDHANTILVSCVLAKSLACISILSQTQFGLQYSPNDWKNPVVAFWI
ncbi:hypothetical protein BCR42DRAFT_397291 [Absidia repens]|uniref:Uncharacterized protein n=1 Tax=Absidia repens TaxID=90262 RepID=A0A1X2I320_9FUNG|nr:hypothetical protein BCR42DRAFT_397291 [Absidia repens]